MNKGRALWLLLRWAGGCGILLLGWTGPAWALDVYGIKVTPSFAYTGEYDDNAFRTPTDELSDYANIFSPGIAVEATPGRHLIQADFRADILRYVNNTNLDTERYFANFSALLNYSQLQFRVKETFAHTDDFPSTELTQRIKRNENYLGGGFDHDLPSLWGIGFDFTWGHINYLDPDFTFLSENSYTYAMNVYYRITAKTRVFAEYNFVQEVFYNDRDRDAYRNRGLLGVRGDLTERFSLTAKGGYEHINYYMSDLYSNQNNFVIALEAIYRPVERLQIGLLISRTVLPSTFANNADYGSFVSTLSAAYNFTPKILILPRLSFGLDNYKVPELNNGVLENRLDFLYGAGIGIQYQLQKWIRLDVRYDFSRRDSNFSEFDYTDNLVSFTVTLSI